MIPAVLHGKWLSLHGQTAAALQRYVKKKSTLLFWWSCSTESRRSLFTTSMRLLLIAFEKHYMWTKSLGKNIDLCEKADIPLSYCFIEVGCFCQYLSLVWGKKKKCSWVSFLTFRTEAEKHISWFSSCRRAVQAEKSPPAVRCNSVAVSVSTLLVISFSDCTVLMIFPPLRDCFS